MLEEHEHIEDGSVDLILTDLPYGTMQGISDGNTSWKNTNTEWDMAINPAEVYNIANRILRKNGKLVLFSQEPYTSRLVTEAISNIPFSYKMSWNKDIYGNALFAKKAPLIFFEDIIVFSKNHDTEDLHPLRNYLRDCKKTSKMTNKQFNNLFSDYTEKVGNRDRSVLEHYWAPSQFCVPTKDIYINVLQATGYFPMEYDKIKEVDDEFKKSVASTFNLWEGNKYKSNILEYKKDYTGYHPTQKPILLLEDLIKTFSNENDLVVDLTMGSGSTGVACVNTNRRFTGIELGTEYFDIASKRIEEAKVQQLTLI